VTEAQRFKAVGSLAVHVNARDTVRGLQERGLGVDVEGDEVLLSIPSAEIFLRLDVVNARRLLDFLSQSVEILGGVSP
jgi:hypothetical protein